MIKAIFLDEDGVLNSKRSNRIYKSFDKYSPESVEALNTVLCRCPDAMIVVTASRRKLSHDRVKALFTKNGILDVEHRVIDFTRNLNRARSYEIDSWLVNYAARFGVCSFVILDDSGNFFPDLKKRLVQTSFETGLQASHVPQIIKILNTQWRRPAF